MKYHLEICYVYSNRQTICCCNLLSLWSTPLEVYVKIAEICQTMKYLHWKALSWKAWQNSNSCEWALYLLLHLNKYYTNLRIVHVYLLSLIRCPHEILLLYFRSINYIPLCSTPLRVKHRWDSFSIGQFNSCRLQSGYTLPTLC